MHQTVAQLAILGLLVLAPGYLDCASTGNKSMLKIIRNELYSRIFNKSSLRLTKDVFL